MQNQDGAKSNLRSYKLIDDMVLVLLFVELFYTAYLQVWMIESVFQSERPKRMSSLIA